MLSKFTQHSKSLLPSLRRNFYAVANSTLTPCLRVESVPMFSDNYGYLVVDEANHSMIAIDPAEFSAFLPSVEGEEQQHAHELLGLLTTHKHWDHAGGNEEFSNKYPQLKIYGPSADNIPYVNQLLNGGEHFKIGNVNVEVLSTPCHTLGHVAYLISGDPDSPPLLFSGDTLFVGGCGRFFEGSAADMYNSLYNVIMNLPLETKIYCGHEYTMSNLRFALSIDPSNEFLHTKIKWAKERQLKNLPTIPSTLAEELQYNPFLRVHELAIKNAVGGEDEISSMHNLRLLKDNFS